MIHRPATPRKPKWVWRICSTLLKQTRRTVIDENVVRQPACARGVLARAKEHPSLIKHARVEYNAVGFFFVKMNIRWETWTKAARKHIYSSVLANFLVNFHLYDESSHIFLKSWRPQVSHWRLQVWFSIKVTQREGGGARTYLKGLHLFLCMCCRKWSCKLSFFLLPFLWFHLLICSDRPVGVTSTSV